METDNTPEKKTQDDVVAIELPAPSGWKKKFTPKKGGTPRRHEIVFISPTGEEIKTKRQLELYLKSHPGGYSASEFDWGTGDTPRRSARLSEKSKTTESSDSETPKKKQRRSSSKKGAKETKDADDEGVNDNEEAAGENEATAEVPTADAEDAGELDDKEAVIENALPQKDGTKDAEQKADEGEEVAKEAEADKENVDVMLKTIATGDTTMDEVAENTSMNKVENQEAGDKPHDLMEEDAENKPLPSTEHEDSKKEAESAPSGLETASLAVPHEAASTGQVSVSVDTSTSKLADAIPKQPTDSNVGQIDQSSENACVVEKVESAQAIAADKHEAQNPGKNSQIQEASKGNQDVSSS